MTLPDRIAATTAFLKEKGIGNVDLAIVLGTGLGQFIEEFTNPLVIPYEEIPHFPIATVEFHSGKLLYGEIEGKMVLAFAGRFHYYEGYNMEEVTFPIRICKSLNAKALLLSNAAGTMNLDFKKGSLMLVDDHINLLPANPLVGKNYDELGPRFPDMSEPYSRSLNAQLRSAAQAVNVELQEGVYVSVMGPNLETRAEYRFLRALGADAVGMSTVPEVIVAKHANLPCACISVLTDECDPDNLKPADINDIIATAQSAEKGLIKITKHFIKTL